MRSASAISIVGALLFLTSVTASIVHSNNRATMESGWTQPKDWLTIINGSDVGEPLNVIISNASSSKVLSDPAPFFSSLFYSPNSCLGFNLGGPQAADLDDGHGVLNQTALYRYNFNNGITTCEESVSGGMHFRYWVQKTTGAIFIAASLEESFYENHMITPNGYNIGRDWLVGNATNSSGTTSPQDSSQYTTTTTTYNASDDIKQSDINHGISFDGGISILTVTQTKDGDGNNVTSPTSSSSSTSTSSSSGASRIGVGTQWTVIAGSIFSTLLLGSLLGGLSLAMTLG